MPPCPQPFLAPARRTGRRRHASAAPRNSCLALYWALLAAALACRSHSELDGVPTQLVWGAEPVVSRGVVARTEHYELLVSALAECSTERGAEGGRRVGVLLTLQARGLLQVPANPYYALLVDDDREVHEATLGGGCTPALPVRLLDAGQSARGWVSFDVPRQRGNFSFSYAPLLASGEREETRFRLSP